MRCVRFLLSAQQQRLCSSSLVHIFSLAHAQGLPAACQAPNGTTTLSCAYAYATSTNRSAASINSAELIAKWQGILQAGGRASSSSSSQDVPTEQLRQLCQDAIHVYSTEGAASVVPDKVTEVFMAAYSQLQGPQQQLQFFKLLVSEFGVQRQAIDEAVQLYLQRAPPADSLQLPTPRTTNSNPQAQGSRSGSNSNSSGDALMLRLAECLSAATQPLYMQLLLPVSQHKAGIQFLVNLRADLLGLLKEQPAAALGQQGAALRALDQDLRAALARWFSLGLLQLQRITWEHSPGQLLQRVQQTEAVHKMTHLEELQRRLQQSDRRVFGFMHPSLPGEPLVVLHTAIMDQVPDCMDAVLTQQQQQQHTQHQHDGSSSSSSSEATVACFYSISSSQKGLAGVDLGNFLIKKAAQLLLAELPQLSTLVTLSPIPGFRAWLIATLRQATAAAAAAADQSSSSDAAQAELFSGPEVASVLQLASMLPQPPSSNSSSSTSSSSSSSSQQAAAAQAMLQLVVDNAWVSLPLRQQEQLRPLLLRLCAMYLLTERRRNFALDPVAHFHLRNGAQLWRINWRADLSQQGLSNSCGLMVNYLYNMEEVVANNQRYLLEHTIAASPAVQQLLG